MSQTNLLAGLERPYLLSHPVQPVADESLAPEVRLSANPAFGDLASPHTPPKDVAAPPMGAVIAAGKNTYVYDAHTYHTKVPPAGIKLLIEHFTDPGHTVLDPFCGSGMTGVAALEAGRHALLSDLSPAAAFIAYNHCTPIDHRRFMAAVRSVLDHTSALQEQLYSTTCRRCASSASMLYTVWSFGLICSECGEQFLLWDVARDERPRVRDSKILSEFLCPHCHVVIRKRTLRRTRRYPVQVGYSCCAGGTKELTAEPDKHDRALLASIDSAGIPEALWYPRDPFPPGVNTRQAIIAGITSVDRAYTTRALCALATLWETASRWPDPIVRSKLLFALTSLYQRVTLFSEFRFWGGSGNTANYNVPAIMNEQNVFSAFERKARTISWYFKEAPRRESKLRVSVHSALNHAFLPDKSVDYVFTDPPFGGNINYSEMNFLWESWLGVKTDPTEETVINRVQGKGKAQYEALLTRSFAEIRRVLKDGGWLTVVFHNSSASVWQALQSAIRNGGFDIVGTQTFDKRHGTFKQFVSDNAVGYDLVLHCRKCTASPETRTTPSEAIPYATAFILERLRRGFDRYRLKYLHVDRQPEFDYRRLYAEWLGETVAQQDVAINFEEFRALVNELRSREAFE